MAFSCTEQPIFAIIFTTVKSNSLPQDDFLASVIKQTIDFCSQKHLQELTAIHSLQEFSKDKE